MFARKTLRAVAAGLACSPGGRPRRRWWRGVGPASASEPPLERAERLGRVAAERGFDWPSAAGPRDKITEELRELDAAIASGDHAAITHELGDVLLSITNLARHLPVPNASACLHQANERFASRFAYVESRLLEVPEASSEQLEQWWEQAKQEER